MDRLQGFLVILLASTIQLTAGYTLERNVPFEFDLSKYKLPEFYYPEINPETIPIFYTPRRTFIPDIDIKQYKLPEDFFPENDRDAIPIFPIKKPSIPGSKRPEDSASIFGTRRYSPGFTDSKNKAFLHNEDEDLILLDRFMSNVDAYESSQDGTLDNFLGSGVRGKNIYNHPKSKLIAKLLSGIIKDLKIMETKKSGEAFTN